ncbi:hypothetical protein [uncultured Dokdonia sp.]|uniref:hypothetical protein n=1 Tax=uncultured Dokdonia sp. TaxID=575653 RepID=UPI0026196CCD|nr:hypothetical protein [uncultured Dokdonia sp.]
MKAKHIVILFLLSFPFLGNAQRSWREDSLQFKVYTRIYFNKQKQIDSVKVQKITCDYCSQEQVLALSEEALFRTRMDLNDPNLKKKGVHVQAHYIRISKKDFQSINNN